MDIGRDSGMADDQGQEPTLKEKQEAFVLAYVGEARFNASKAARIAGYSEASAGQEGYRLLKKAQIRARIDKHLEAMTIGATEVLAELTDVATAGWRDFIEARVVGDNRGEDEAVTVRVRFDLGSKIKALELLGKHHALFTDRVDHTGTVTFAELFTVANPGGSQGGPDGGGGS